MACDIRERNLSTTTQGVFKSQISQEKERHYIYIYISTIMRKISPPSSYNNDFLEILGIVHMMYGSMMYLTPV